MARIRTLKPEFWTDEKVGSLKRDQRLLFIGLLNLADDEGVLKATPAFIKGQLLAYDDEVKVSDVKDWLEGLESEKMIISFHFNSEKYFLIRTFKNHQKINRPTPSQIPKKVIEKVLNDNGMSNQEQLTEDSVRTHGAFSEDSLPERKGKEEERNGEREGNGYTRDAELEKSILEFFGFNDLNHDKARSVNEFCRGLHLSDRLELFRDQFKNYCEFKKLNQGYIHSFQKFLGSQENRFEDGAWNAENWSKKLESEKVKSNGTKNSANNGRPVATSGKSFGKL